MKAQERSTIQQNRRGFVRRCLGVGASLATVQAVSSHAVGSGNVQMPNYSTMPGMTEYESSLSRTDCMYMLGNPRSWSLVSQGLHPFHPQRVVMLPNHSTLLWRRHIDRGLLLVSDSGHQLLDLVCAHLP
jgi:hypothetical protein